MSFFLRVDLQTCHVVYICVCDFFYGLRGDLCVYKIFTAGLYREENVLHDLYLN